MKDKLWNRSSCFFQPEDALSVNVSPGGTVQLSLSSKRSITGRLNVADIHKTVDLTQCRVNVILKMPPPPVTEGLVEWVETEAGKAYEAAAPTCSLLARPWNPAKGMTT